MARKKKSEENFMRLLEDFSAAILTLNRTAVRFLVLETSRCGAVAARLTVVSESHVFSRCVILLWKMSRSIGLRSSAAAFSRSDGAA